MSAVNLIFRRQLVNYYCQLNFTFKYIPMVACKAMLNMAVGVDHSSMVTVMARN
jgi:hypothetical protein